MTELPVKSSIFKKIVFFDYLRAIAILFIAFFHYVLEVTLFHIRPSVTLSYAQNLQLLEVFPHQSPFSGVGNLLVFIASQGYQFVGVFIFLSGFGITYSKLSKGAKPWGWVKRIIRLSPQFQIAIVFAFIINYISLHYLRRYLIAAPTLEYYPYLRLLLYPLVWGDFYALISSINPSLWFSGLILQFYIVVDGLHWLLMKLKPWLFLGLALVVTVLYRYVTLFDYDGDPFLFSLLPVRLFEFALGMAVAYIYVIYDYDVFYRITWWWGLAVGIALWYIGFRLGYTENGRVVNDLLTTSGLMVVGTIVFRNLKTGWVASVLGIVGVQSYWIYLLHNQPITQLLTPWTFKEWDAHGMSGMTLLLGFGIILIFTICLSLLMNHRRKVLS